MGPIKISFTPDKGGLQNFDARDEAIKWIHSERLKFEDTFVEFEAAQFVPEINSIQRAWIALEGDIRDASFGQNKDFLSIKAPEDIFTSLSPVAEVIQDIAGSMGAIALRGALYAADITVEVLDWSRTETLAGIQAYQIGISRIRRKDNNPIPAEYRGRIAEFSDEIHTIRSKISSINAELSKTSAIATSGTASTENSLLDLTGQVEAVSAQLITQVRDAEVRLDASVVRSEKEINDCRVKSENFVSEVEQKLEDWIKAQTEAVRLTAPVTLWEDRNKTHTAAAEKLGRFAIAAGVLGTVATPFLSAFAFAQARSMLADALPKASDKTSSLVALGIRPTLHYELIFAGASTLFWLTMFFWLLRILVRRYVAEQRLAVDASGRAAMTQTYLGLIMEHAAGEQERPIVLEALFRPVTDNSKGDDGPPSTSVAAIVAALAAGKN